MFRCKHPYIRYLWITDRWMVWIWVDRPFRLLSKGCWNQKSSISTRSLRNVLLKSRQSIPMAWWTGLLITSWLSAILWTGTRKQDRQVVQDQIWTWNNWFSLFFCLFFLCAAGHTESQILFFANKGLKMQETLIRLFPQKTGEIVSPTLISLMHNLNIDSELLFGEQVLQLGGPFQSFIQSVTWQGLWSCLAPGRWASWICADSTQS